MSLQEEKEFIEKPTRSKSLSGFEFKSILGILLTLILTIFVVGQISLSVSMWWLIWPIAFVAFVLLKRQSKLLKVEQCYERRWVVWSLIWLVGLLIGRDIWLSIYLKLLILPP